MSVRALIIDDSPMARKIIAYYLRSARCTIVGQAENAAQGLELFRKHTPNLVTLDLMMPKIGGLDSMELLDTIWREQPRVVVVVVSVIPFGKTREDLLERGVLAYVVKPLTDQNFAPVLEKLKKIFPELKPPLG